MLDKPKHGWSKLAIDDHSWMVSYLVDIPVKWPLALAAALTNRHPAALYADLEGSELYLCIDPGSAFAVTDGEDLLTDRLTVRLEPFARQFLADVEADLDDWIRWEPDTEFMTDLSERETTVRNALDALRTALDE